MKTLPAIIAALAFSFGLVFVACDLGAGSTGPNDLGGETNLELTAVGGVFATYLDAGTYIPAFDRLHDSAVITKNDNGIVTTHVKATFDSVFVAALDSALGTSSLPESMKRSILDTYLKKYNATIDTVNKDAMKVVFDLKMKVTSEGIQEFVNGGGDLSRPFTIVKYGASVGDIYEFTTPEGVKITRKVTYKSTTDDYAIGFFLIKVIKVEQTQEDPIVEKITYYTNHKFGLVGVVLRTKTGKELKIGIFPPNM